MLLIACFVEFIHEARFVYEYFCMHVCMKIFEARFRDYSQNSVKISATTYLS